ncbi:hypothetical protein [Paenibacillus sp. Z6-24]
MNESISREQAQQLFEEHFDYIFRIALVMTRSRVLANEMIRGFAPFTDHNPHPKPKSTTIKIPLHWERKEQPEPERQPKTRRKDNER